jgi:hypothetical protein
MLSTLGTFQAARLWLNLAADSNMPLMKVTDAKFQAARFWLNVAADLNISAM